MFQKYLKLVHIFPEVETWNSDKIIQCLIELFDKCDLTASDIDLIRNEQKALKYLLSLPKVEQRSKEWFDLRENRLTASDLAQSMNKGKFGKRSDLLVKKAFPVAKPFDMLPPLKWGVMFEDMGMRCYQEKKNGVFIHEFGLIPHPTIDCFGASPDGITESGVMVEMKCPYRRKFDGQIPEQYYIQIQGQLATCGLTQCDYVECYFVVFENMVDYELCLQDGDSHGIIVEYAIGNDFVYDYSPPSLSIKQCQNWANQCFDDSINAIDRKFIKFTPWKLRQMFIERVHFDSNMWNQCIPGIYNFWNDVLELRAKGEPVIEPKKATKSLTVTLNYKKEQPKYKFIIDSDEEN